MKKITVILMMVMTMTSCGSNSREDLFYAHIETLVNETYQVNDNIPFEITGRYMPNNNNYQMELIFDRARADFFDITILLVDNRQKDYQESPFNLGYFNDSKLNFIKGDSEETDTSKKAYRFNWVSATHDLSMKIVFTYMNDEIREEVYLDYSGFKLYSEVSYGY